MDFPQFTITLRPNAFNEYCKQQYKRAYTLFSHWQTILHKISLARFLPPRIKNTLCVKIAPCARHKLYHSRQVSRTFLSFTINACYRRFESLTEPGPWYILIYNNTNIVIDVRYQKCSFSLFNLKEIYNSVQYCAQPITQLTSTIPLVFIRLLQIAALEGSLCQTGMCNLVLPTNLKTNAPPTIQIHQVLTTPTQISELINPSELIDIICANANNKFPKNISTFAKVIVLEYSSRSIKICNFALQCCLCHFVIGGHKLANRPNRPIISNTRYRPFKYTHNIGKHSKEKKIMSSKTSNIISYITRHSNIERLTHHSDRNPGSNARSIAFISGGVLTSLLVKKVDKMSNRMGKYKPVRSVWSVITTVVHLSIPKRRCNSHLAENLYSHVVDFTVNHRHIGLEKLNDLT
jgi:hypothetical protein